MEGGDGRVTRSAQRAAARAAEAEYDDVGVGNTAPAAGSKDSTKDKKRAPARPTLEFDYAYPDNSDSESLSYSDWAVDERVVDDNVEMMFAGGDVDETEIERRKHKKIRTSLLSLETVKQIEPYPCLVCACEMKEHCSDAHLGFRKPDGDAPYFVRQELATIPRNVINDIKDLTGYLGLKKMKRGSAR